MLPVIHITQELTQTWSVSFGEPSSDSGLPQTLFKGYWYLGCLYYLVYFCLIVLCVTLLLCWGLPWQGLWRRIVNRQGHTFRDAQSLTLCLLLPEGGGRWRSPAQAGSLCQEGYCVLGSGVLCHSWSASIGPPGSLASPGWLPTGWHNEPWHPPGCAPETLSKHARQRGWFLLVDLKQAAQLLYLFLEEFVPPLSTTCFSSSFIHSV